MENLCNEVLTKTVYEDREFNFEWADVLATGETISSESVTVSPTGVTVGTPATSGTLVQVTLSSGTANTTYELTCRITTSLGQDFEAFGLLQVVPAGPFA
jgi:hypothetical protein